MGNLNYGEYLAVPLSTVDQQRSEIGRRAASMLVELIAAEASATANLRPLLLEPRLLIRESSRRREMHGRSSRSKP